MKRWCHYRCIRAFALCLAGVVLLGSELHAQSSSADEEPAWLVPMWGVYGVVDDEQSALGGFDLRSRLNWHGLHPAVSAFRSSEAALLIGVGLVYNHEFTERFRVTLGFLPSYYDQGDGPELGRSLEFLSFIEGSMALNNGHRINLRFGHISNAGVAPINPGTELLTVGYAIPLP